MPCICARLLKSNSFGCWIQTVKVWRKSTAVKQTSCIFLEACIIYAALLHYKPLPCSRCTGENVSETSSCVRVIGTLTAAFAAGLLYGGRSGWLNHCGRRSFLQLTSFWQLRCPFCITRVMFLIVWWTPLGMSVQNNLQDAWLALQTVYTLWDIQAGYPWGVLVIRISVSLELCTPMVFVVLDIPPGSHIC